MLKVPFGSLWMMLGDGDKLHMVVDISWGPGDLVGYGWTACNKGGMVWRHRDGTHMSVPRCKSCLRREMKRTGV